MPDGVRTRGDGVPALLVFDDHTDRGRRVGLALALQETATGPAAALHTGALHDRALRPEVDVAERRRPDAPALATDTTTLRLRDEAAHVAVRPGDLLDAVVDGLGHKRARPQGGGTHSTDRP